MPSRSLYTRRRGDPALHKHQEPRHTSPHLSPLSNPQLSLCPLDLPSPSTLLVQLWVTERLPMASSREHGKDLPSVQLLMKKNQVRQRLKAKAKAPRASSDMEVRFFLRPGFLSPLPPPTPLEAVCTILAFSGWPLLVQEGGFPQ